MNLRLNLDDNEPTLVTPRLDLVHIGADELLLIDRDPLNELIWVSKSFTNPYRELVDSKGPLPWRVPQVEKDPLLNKWFLRWIVLRDTQEVIGTISFHGAPDDNGMVEIGLGINEKFRNQGFAKEALFAMWKWVSTQPNVKVLRYTVSPDNLPSIAIINSFGFTYIGEQIDEEDGPESIYEKTVQDFLKTV